MDCNFLIYGGGFIKTEASGFLCHDNHELKDCQVQVGLKIFDNGSLVLKKDNFCKISFNETYEFSSRKFKEFANQEKCLNRLFVLDCSINPHIEGYFKMDGQVTYTDKKREKFATVLYDTIPIPSERSIKSPFILLDHKVWLSKDINTYVLLMNNIVDLNQNNTNVFTLSIFDEEGQLLKTKQIKGEFKASTIINVKELLKDYITLNNNLIYLNLVAKGLSSPTAILTYTKNLNTGNLSVEHSLPPYYYIRGKILDIRKTALNFEEHE